MAIGTCAPQAPYKNLADMLLAHFGNDHSMSWLAQKTEVTRAAVHLWLTGRCRPKPARLGHIAAILDLDPDILAELAGYLTEEDKDRVRSGYDEWLIWRQQRQGLARVERAFVERIRMLALHDPATQVFLENTCPEYLSYIRVNQGHSQQGVTKN